MFASLFVFLLVVFLYIYVVHQWKYSENLEVFELDFVEDCRHVQEACDLRQPLVFPLSIGAYGVVPPFQIAIKDTRDYYTASPLLDSVEMSWDRGRRFLQEAPPHYFSEGNPLLLRKELDDWLRPSFTAWSQHDLWLGTKGVQTPWRYHTKYRQFFCPVTAPVTVRLLPWSALTGEKDFEFYEFFSKQDKDRCTSDVVVVVVNPGQILHVPSYWWYSVEYTVEAAELIVCSYITMMNAFAHAHDLARFWLQRQSIAYTPKGHKKKITDQHNERDLNLEPAAEPQHHDDEEKKGGGGGLSTSNDAQDAPAGATTVSAPST